MNFSKKGIESYLLVIIIISFVLSILISTVFSPLLANDHEKCQSIDYEILSKKNSNQLEINIKNTGNSKINFIFIDNKIEILPTQESKKFSMPLPQEDSYDIIPLYIDLQGEQYKCSGKKETIKINLLT